MEDQQGYGQNQNSQNQVESQLPQPTKKRRFSTFLYVFISLALIAATGIGVYYYMANKQVVDKENNKSDISLLKSQLYNASSELMTLKSKQSETASTSTSSANKTKSELDSLRTFCQGTDPNTTVGVIVYVENPDGKYASCGIGTKNSPGGAVLISYMKNDQWTKIITTQSTPPLATCKQYLIPYQLLGPSGKCE